MPKKRNPDDSDGESMKSALSSLTAALADLSRAVVVDARVDVTREVGNALREASEELQGAAATVRAATGDKRTKSEETRAAIMEAGARLFAERGYEGAGVTDIAKAAGFTKGALYAHFPSKEDLFVAIATESTWARSEQTPEPDPEDMLADLEVDALDPALSQDILLGLETAMFMIRHPETAADLRETYRQVLTAAALDLDSSAPTKDRTEPTPQPSDAAFDRLIAISGVNTQGILLTLATGDSRIDASRKRIITRLITDTSAPDTTASTD